MVIRGRFDHPSTAAGDTSALSDHCCCGNKNGCSNGADTCRGACRRQSSLGTFYRAPKPGAQPFIEVGHRVEATTELCLIEVMKLFTTLRAGAAGVVSKILVSDGELIERGQSLFAIDPNG
jgi:acetyl-CoA carboxylase biotin carboxyl carrier protein